MPALRLRFLLFVLALAVQALAPIAIGVAVGEHAHNGSGEICFKTLGGVDHVGRPAPGHSHQRDCPVCQVFCDGVAPVQASTATGGSASPVHWAMLRWRIADNFAPAMSGRFAHRARAPPSA